MVSAVGGLSCSVSRYYSYLNTTKEILSMYGGMEPLVVFLKKYFATRKNMGASDRKQVAQLCYSYMRLGKALMEIPMEERMLIGFFLCATGPTPLLRYLRPSWNEMTDKSLEEKWRVVGGPSPLPNVFPCPGALSDPVDYEQLNRSCFVQPDLFIRIRPGQEETVKNKLRTAGLPHVERSSTCWSLANSSQVDKHIELDKEAVIQDLSSQRVASFFPGALTGKKTRVWDCCAGSGGKSILYHDHSPAAVITVSDKRNSILVNLEKRFKRAGIRNYHSFLVDLASEVLPPDLPSFPFIIADLPCTGSGTWSRSPEQLSFFQEKNIEEYASLQRKIAMNALGRLEPGGYFLYITCSVFREENEAIVEHIQDAFSAAVLRMEVLTGYHQKADTLFAALLQRGS